MPTSITLVPFTLRFRKKNDTSDTAYFAFNDLPNGTDVYDELSSLCQKLNGRSHVDDDRQNAFRVKRYSAKQPERTLLGILESGEFGFEAELLNVKTNAATKRTKHDCQMLPFFFSAWLPEKKRIGVIVLQRFGIYGVKTAFEQRVNEIFAKKEPEVVVEFNALISEERAKEILGSSVRRIRLIRQKVSDDVASALGLETNSEDEPASMELVVKVKGHARQTLTKQLKNCMKGKADAEHGLIEVSGVEYDEVKVEMKFGGKTRTVNLRKSDVARMDLDVTSQIKFGDDGHPTYPSIMSAGAELLNALKSNY